MQRSQVLEFAQILQLGTPARTSTAEWLHFRCPFAQWRHDHGRDRTASFNLFCSDHEHSRYWCFGCKSSGELHQLFLELGQLRGVDYRQYAQEVRRQELLGPQFVARPWGQEVYNPNETPTKAQIILPPQEYQYHYYSAAGHPYLRERGISAYTAIALGLRWDPYQQRILFPVQDERGRFAGFTGRSVIPPAYYDDEGVGFDASGDEYLKVRDYHGLNKRALFLGEPNRNGRNRLCGTYGWVYGAAAHRIIICEGLFDYATFVECGYIRTLALLGSSITPEKVEKLLRWRLPIVMFLDNDKAGNDGRDILKSYLLGKVPLLDVKYPDGYDGTDPGSLISEPHVIHQMLQGAELVLR